MTLVNKEQANQPSGLEIIFIKKFMPKLSDFDFDLPEQLIAQMPVNCRTQSRLLITDAEKLIDAHFVDILHTINAGDLLVFNDTKVIRARLFGEKHSGGKIEVLVERVLGEDEFIAKIRASKSPKANSTIILSGEIFVMLGRAGSDSEFFHLRWENPQQNFASLWDFFEACGKLPLPPYIARAANKEDEARYQTVFAREFGAVAAPTAGLHFDEILLAALRQKGVEMAYLTLHVGAGTFQPVRFDNLADHKMHEEFFHLPEETVTAIHQAKKRGARVICVGTTSLRALESAAARDENLQAGSDSTRIFITPGFPFKIADALITNFHLPKSTLLMLVSAFTGSEKIKQIYAHAIKNKYRFFSYGDAMFLSHEKPSK